MKYLLYALLVAAMLLGIGCLNYTKAFGIEAHHEFAETNGLPGPSPLIFYSGLLLLLASTSALGYLTGKRAMRRQLERVSN